MSKIEHGQPFFSTGELRGSGTAGSLTVSIAGTSGRKHYLTDVSSYSDWIDGVLVIKDATNGTLWEVMTGGSAASGVYDHSFVLPVESTEGETMSISLNGSGLSTIKISVRGVTGY